MQDVDDRDDEPQSRGTRSYEPAEPEQHSLLELPDDLDGHGEYQQDEKGDDNHKEDQNSHGVAP
ncbi:hypothetical protein GCM10010341_60260 [Streptomyces noursei]|nr:hypothetical protein GCM10010341_60260 [Streptomyces noursei]